MWFDNVAASENPGREELHMFVCDLRNFFAYVLDNTKEFYFLWEESPELRELAIDTFRFDISEGAGLDLGKAIPYISSEKLHQHGLEGRPLRFKFKVLNAIGNRWEKVRGQLSVREWFKKIIDAIDAILDSLIDAAGGTGGLIKEFKDALGALA